VPAEGVFFALAAWTCFRIIALLSRGPTVESRRDRGNASGNEAEQISAGVGGIGRSEGVIDTH
jgi:hypothetical protein